MVIFIRIFLIALLLQLSLNSFADSKIKTITLGVTSATLKSSQGQFLKKLSSEILKRLNYQLKIVVLPAIRLAHSTKTQKIDGELVRMSDYGKNHPHLTRVEEPSFNFTIAAYSHNKNIKLKNWQSLLVHKVGYRRGMKVVHNELLKIIEQEKLSEFVDINRAMKLLVIKRVDVIVDIQYFVDEYLKVNQQQFKEYIFKVKKLKQDSAHIFLGKKYSFLAAQMSKELKEMKKSGAYFKIRKSIKKQTQ